MRRIGLVAAVVFALASTPAFADTEAAPPGHWQSPRCGVVNSDGSVSFTRDEGRTITPTAVRQRPVQYAFSLVSLPKANNLLSVDSHGKLQVSYDAGCSWRPFSQVDGLDAPRLSAGRDDQAYLWDVNGRVLYRIDGLQVTPLPPVSDTEGMGIAAVAVNRYLPWHVRVVLSDGTIRDSFDAGKSFHTTGMPVNKNLYSASIDPWNINHITIGTMGEGVYTTWFGGWLWSHNGLGKPGEEVNAFSVVVSPADPQVVWAQGINIAENDAHAPSEGRHIYRSTDGGRTFRVAVDHKPGVVTLVNGALLAPSPTDANVLYFIFGTSFAKYGTDLFRYDARHQQLSVQHNSHDGIKSIAFNPWDRSVMYLGFAAER